jgi:hypothetical protein
LFTTAAATNLEVRKNLVANSSPDKLPPPSPPIEDGGLGIAVGPSALCGLSCNHMDNTNLIRISLNLKTSGTLETKRRGGLSPRDHTSKGNKTISLIHVTSRHGTAR